MKCWANKYVGKNRRQNPAPPCFLILPGILSVVSWMLFRAIEGRKWLHSHNDSY